MEKGMKTIKSDRVVMIDCDDTLILWDKSEHDPSTYIEINCYGQTSVVVPHQKQLNTIHKFIKLGYTLIVWSASGWEWAEAVGKAVGIDDYVQLYLSKPRYYMDDIPCNEWMGPRVYRSPNEE
jgi:hypothetical protein